MNTQDIDFLNKSFILWAGSFLRLNLIIFTEKSWDLIGIYIITCFCSLNLHIFNVFVAIDVIIREFQDSI